MTKMNEIGLTLCRYQAKLFEYAAKQKISSKQFIKKFAYSYVAVRMDSIGFLLESIDVPQAYLEVTNGDSIRGIVYSEKIMNWIGYIYRYICYVYQQPMKRVYKLIKPKELYDLYDAYHSLDNDLAVQRILEAKSINFDTNDDLELLKKIYGFSK